LTEAQIAAFFDPPIEQVNWCATTRYLLWDLAMIRRCRGDHTASARR
jgi:hypothetical protein